jgi:hypothetical protein
MGINPSNLYFDRPENIEVGYEKFFQIFKNLEKRKYISRTSFVGGNYCINEMGEEYIGKLLKKLKKRDYNAYYSLLEYSPIIELKEKIRSIQNFIINGIILSALIFLINQYPPDSIYIFIFLMVLTVIFFVLTMSNLSYIASDMGLEIRKKYVGKFWSFVDKNEDLFFNIFYIVVLGLGLLLINKFLGLELQAIVTFIILTLFIEYFLKRRTLRSIFKRYKEKIKILHIGRK